MSDPSLAPLINAIVEGDRKKALAEIKKLLASHTSRQTIITGGLEEAMKQLETKCTVEQFNLLEIMVAGRAAMEVMNYLYPRETPPHSTKATVVIGTPEGDVHDLGKNILKMILIADGYRVVDCGKDCPLDVLIDTVKVEKAAALCVSGLITPTIPLVKQIRRKLTARNAGSVRIIAGGAALKQASAESLNVDFVCETAFDAAGYLNRETVR